MKSKFKSRAVRAGGILLLLWAALRFLPLNDEALRKDYSSLFLAQDQSLLRLSLNGAGRYRVKLPLSEISPEVLKGFLAYEDRWFYWHPGLNPVSLARASWLNLSSGKVKSGASTITMQLAKLIKRRPRTFFSKLIEAFQTLELEARYSKKEILELYLNSVPMGGNIEGVGAAAWLYFGKPAKLLSVGEAALLVSLPRSPSGRRPDRAPEKAREGRDKVLARIAPLMDTPPLQLKEALEAKIPDKRQKNPFKAPHLLARVERAERSQAQAYGLSLDTNLQLICEEELSKALERLRRQGVHNGALILVDNATMRVLAYVGGPGLSESEGGHINGADILRSPGSSLKPFVYGLALEAGLITPSRILYDIPKDFAGYRPVNMEGRFMGPLRAEDALIHSINTTAVGLEANLKEKKGLAAWLKDEAGLRGRGRQDLNPGLAVVLGAYPVSLEEETALYAMLANGGMLRPLRFLSEISDPGPPQAGRRVLSEESAFIVSEMLSKVERPDLPTVWEASPTRAKAAFKTGTSFGFKDAWCLGYTPEFTLGVWLGNANAKGSTALRGSKAASPLFFAVLNRLTRHRDAWFKAPAGVSKRQVCSLTGEAASEHCPDKIEDWCVPGISDARPCRLHQSLWIRKKDGLEVCPHCMTGEASAYQRKVFEIWPPDIARFLRGSRKGLKRLPAHNPSCTFFANRPGPRILSPAKGGRYEINEAIPKAAQRIALSAQAGQDVETLFWFEGDVLLHSGKADDIFSIEPIPGSHKLSVIDNQGRADVAEFKVEWKAAQAAPKGQVVELGD